MIHNDKLDDLLVHLIGHNQEVDLILFVGVNNKVFFARMDVQGKLAVFVSIIGKLIQSVCVRHHLGLGYGGDELKDVADIILNILKLSCTLNPLLINNLKH